MVWLKCSFSTQHTAYVIDELMTLEFSLSMNESFTAYSFPAKVLTHILRVSTSRLSEGYLMKPSRPLGR